MYHPSSQWAHLYNNKQWRKVRAAQLASEPLCRFCLQMGRTTAATVCDHIEPHNGDLDKFWHGPFQSLCKTCHDGTKQAQDKGAGLRGCDTHGVPLDAGHHWQRADG